MTISKGTSWGEPGRLPADGIAVRTDREAGLALEAARRDGRPFPTIGLLGGDLARTLGATGDDARLDSADAMRFPVDLGEVLIDGRLHLFVAHVIAHSRSWRRVVAALNAQWLGPWNAGPKAHPNDGVLDVLDARLTWGDLPKVRARLPLGAYLPHPRIASRRLGAWTVELDRPLPVRVDGRPVGAGRVLAFHLRPDALSVVV